MIVNVVKYQENCDELYHKEKRELLNRLDDTVLKLYHVGSTA